MFTQPIEVLQIFEQGDSSNRQNRLLLLMLMLLMILMRAYPFTSPCLKMVRYTLKILQQMLQDF